jgi:hypothetical protein
MHPCQALVKTLTDFTYTSEALVGFGRFILLAKFPHNCDDISKAFEDAAEKVKDGPTDELISILKLVRDKLNDEKNKIQAAKSAEESDKSKETDSDSIIPAHPGQE